MGELLLKVNSYKAIERSEYKQQGRFPILNQGQEMIAGYSDREDLALTTSEYIVFGDHTRVIKYIDRSFIAGESGTLVFSVSDLCRPKYLYFAFQNLEIQSRGYNRHWSVVKDMQIQVPSIETQDRIISILERFSSITGEFKDGLPAEIQARRQQYEYYRGKLLTFKELKSA
jgi:type I restriction enzyme S subunit